MSASVTLLVASTDDVEGNRTVSYLCAYKTFGSFMLFNAAFSKFSQYC